MKIYLSSVIFFLSFLIFNTGCKNNKSATMEKELSPSENYYVTFHTTMGDITVKLYNETPLHRDNFVKLAREGYYNGVLFHRVIKDFMIQGGDPDSKNAAKGQRLGNGGPGYTIPAEIRPGLFHKKGALAAARTGDRTNPERASSGSQFYIVQGTTFTDDQLNQIEQRINQTNKNNVYYYFQKIITTEMKDSSGQADPGLINREVMVRATDSLDHYIPFRFSATERDIYKTSGGAPHLDGGYTVFGEVVSGLDIVDKIASVATDQNNRPLQDVKILNTKVTRK